MMKEILENVPIVGQAYGLTKTAMIVYNSTSPIEAVKNATLSIIIDCTPPVIKYPVKCAVFALSCTVAVTSGGNPFSVSLAIGAAKQLIMKN